MFNPASPTHFSLTIDDFAHDLQVLSFIGSEGISQPYRFDIELVSENRNLELQALLHRPAFLAFDRHGAGIHGVIHGIGHGDVGKRLTRYTITLRPQLHYLQHRRNQRIFQNRSTAQIIAQILEEHGILGNAYRFQLDKPCPEREYCVQYKETDEAFISRLCEEDGIHYHFQHSPTGHLLLFGDHQSLFQKLGQPTAYVQDSGTVADDPVINAFKLRLETRTGSVTRRDYDFEQPSLLLESDYTPDATISGPRLEDYDYPGRFTQRDHGRYLARLALERHRRDYQRVEGHSNQPRLLSGHLLQVTDHPTPEWNDLWLLNAIVHEGKQPQVLEESISAASAEDFQQGYRNSFLATPWNVFYRPPLEHRKPRMPGSQTAIVTGPKGEEIHCDEYGRVKVQFHWDRDGQHDEHSSCWLRVANGWSGAFFGAITIPRIGMEVLVDFLESDPDQPLITGCLYNRAHPAPYALPANKTRSVLKTLSSPGGGGSNELRSEDKTGAEQLYFHAQRDWDERIQHDQKIHVGHQRHDTVENHSYSERQAEEQRITHGDRKTAIKGDDHLSVGGSQHIKLDMAQRVSAGQVIHLKAGEKMVIEAGLEITVKAGDSFIKLDASGITVNGPLAKMNAGGTAGTATGVDSKLPELPLIADQARAGKTLTSAAASSAVYDEQLRFVTGTGKPVRSVNSEVFVEGATTLTTSKTGAEGLHPRIKTDTARAAEVHLRWKDLIVRSGADDYDAGRQK